MDMRIYAKGKLTDKAGAIVGVEHFIHLLVMVGSRLDNFSVSEFKADILIGYSLVNRRRVVA